MKVGRILFCMGLVFLATLAFGCAPAYHRYSRGCVPCKYCAPPPLPYSPYGCACHSQQAEPYLGASPESPTN